MFCTQCGKQAVEGAVYCAFCGARMHAADQGPDTAIDEQKTGNDGSSGDRGEWARRWSERSPLRSTAAIGITLVLVVGGGWALRASLGGANTGRSMRGAQQAEGSQGDASVVVRVSVATTGMEGNGESYGRAHCMSKTCQFVAFDSDATNLVAGDTNGFTDVFVRDQASGRTERVSVSSAGAEANQWSGCPAISADGTVVAFESNATNLVSGDTNGAGDVFVHDRRTGETVRASVSTTGAQAHGVSSVDDISDDGLFVAFTSDAADLVPGDTDSRMDVFVHDRASGQTERAVVSAEGGLANDGGICASVSGDGRFVAFQSSASDIVPKDANACEDVFVLHRQTRRTERVSVSSTGGEGNGDSDLASISADGRFVAFSSEASDLVPNDTNGCADVFVHDRMSGQTTRVSASSAGEQGLTWSLYPSISANGRFVAFCSEAPNLVAGDTNGSRDVFVHDRATGMTTRVSISRTGVQSNAGSSSACISLDGLFVALQSEATNLVPGDSNNCDDLFLASVSWRQAQQTRRLGGKG